MDYNNDEGSFRPDDPWQSIRENLNLQIAVFGGIWLICGLLGGLFTNLIANIAGIHDFRALMKGIAEGNYLEHINTLKFLQINSHLFQYLIPVIVFTYLLYPQNKLKSLYADKIPRPVNVILGLLLITILFPFVYFVYYWNTILLPEGSISTEILALQAKMLDMKSIEDFVLNLIIFGIVAGVGEEVLFRGVLQRFFTQFMKNIHWGALLTGLVFSLMHFQLEGFIPRFLLGTLFSYILVFSGNLWICILVHVFFNSIQVIIPYLNPEMAENVSQVEVINPFLAIGSLVGFIIILFIFMKVNPKNKHIDFK